jgi:hypothetical protein
VRCLVAILAITLGWLCACGEPGESSVVDSGGGGIDTLCFTAVCAGCDPVAQMGCADGEKCTWQHVTDTLGRLTCTLDGTVPLGDVCTRMPPGETAGYDDCAGGGYCLAGTCREICTEAPDSCEAPSSCTLQPGLFDGASDPTGLCEP